TVSSMEPSRRDKAQRAVTGLLRQRPATGPLLYPAAMGPLPHPAVMAHRPVAMEALLLQAGTGRLPEVTANR
ncbi:MAG: hypothetical protein ACM3MD_10255, partial [Betaproteobacteria bacterium]